MKKARREKLKEKENVEKEGVKGGKWKKAMKVKEEKLEETSWERREIYCRKIGEGNERKQDWDGKREKIKENL